MLCHVADCGQKAACVEQVQNVYFLMCARCVVRLKKLVGEQLVGFPRPLPRKT